MPTNKLSYIKRKRLNHLSTLLWGTPSRWHTIMTKCTNGGKFKMWVIEEGDRFRAPTPYEMGKIILQMLRISKKTRQKMIASQRASEAPSGPSLFSKVSEVGLGSGGSDEVPV